MTTTKPRWTRVLSGWYSLNIRTATGIFSAEVIKNDLGMWDIKVNEVAAGMADSLKSAQASALAAF